MKAFCLCDNVAPLAGWANDMGYKYCLSEQLANLLNKGGVVIGFSGNGIQKMY